MAADGRHNMDISVVLRVRPASTAELDAKNPEYRQAVVCNGPVARLDLSYLEDPRFQPLMHKKDYTFRFQGPGTLPLMPSYVFDRIFQAKSDVGEEGEMAELYKFCVSGCVESVMNGKNATVFTYGARGSGRQFVVDGSAGMVRSEEGMLQMSMRDILKGSAGHQVYAIRVSYYQVYNENVLDMLTPPGTRPTPLRIREDKNGCAHVVGLTECTVHSAADIIRLTRKARAQLSHGDSNAKYCSHFVLTVTVQQAAVTSSAKTVPAMAVHTNSCLNFVTLAAQDVTRQDHSSHLRAQEAKTVALGLNAVLEVTAGLSQAHQHLRYRDSKLTYSLKSSLRAENPVVFVTNVSPALSSYYETMAAFKYSVRLRSHAGIGDDHDRQSEGDADELASPSHMAGSPSNTATSDQNPASESMKRAEISPGKVAYAEVYGGSSPKHPVNPQATRASEVDDRMDAETTNSVTPNIVILETGKAGTVEIVRQSPSPSISRPQSQLSDARRSPSPHTGMLVWRDPTSNTIRTSPDPTQQAPLSSNERKTFRPPGSRSTSPPKLLPIPQGAAHRALSPPGTARPVFSSSAGSSFVREVSPVTTSPSASRLAGASKARTPAVHHQLQEEEGDVNLTLPRLGSGRRDGTARLESYRPVVNSSSDHGHDDYPPQGDDTPLAMPGSFPVGRNSKLMEKLNSYKSSLESRSGPLAPQASSRQRDSGPALAPPRPKPKVEATPEPRKATLNLADIMGEPLQTGHNLIVYEDPAMNRGDADDGHGELGAGLMNAVAEEVSDYTHMLGKWLELRELHTTKEDELSAARLEFRISLTSSSGLDPFELRKFRASIRRLDTEVTELRDDVRAASLFLLLSMRDVLLTWKHAATTRAWTIWRMAAEDSKYRARRDRRRRQKKAENVKQASNPPSEKDWRVSVSVPASEAPSPTQEDSQRLDASTKNADDLQLSESESEGLPANDAGASAGAAQSPSSGTMQAWASHWLLKWQQQAAFRLRVRYLERRIVAAIARWRDYAALERQSRRRMLLAHHHITHRQVLNAFQYWRIRCEKAFQQRLLSVLESLGGGATVEGELKEMKEKQKIIERERDDLVLAVERIGEEARIWKDKCVVSEGKQEDIVSSFRLARTVTSCFYFWKKIGVERKRQSTNLVAHALLHWRYFPKRLSFLKWKGIVSEQKILTLQALKDEMLAQLEDDAHTIARLQGAVNVVKSEFEDYRTEKELEVSDMVAVIEKQRKTKEAMVRAWQAEITGMIFRAWRGHTRRRLLGR